MAGQRRVEGLLTSERGFALLMVLLVLALVAIVGAEFSYSMRLEASAVRAVAVLEWSQPL